MNFLDRIIHAGTDKQPSWVVVVLGHIVLYVTMVGILFLLGGGQ